MAKRKEIKFRTTVAQGTTLEGRQNGVIYRIYWDRTLAGTGKPAHTVTAYNTKESGKAINTAGHIGFKSLDDAKEFCQKIAAREIKLEDLQAKFDAEDDAKERAVFREITEKAKKFHARLDAMGLKYRDLLELEVLAHSLGDMGHNILLGYERGEGWPSGT